MRLIIFFTIIFLTVTFFIISFFTITLLMIFFKINLITTDFENHFLPSIFSDNFLTNEFLPIEFYSTFLSFFLSPYSSSSSSSFSHIHFPVFVYESFSFYPSLRLWIGILSLFTHLFHLLSCFNPFFVVIHVSILIRFALHVFHPIFSPFYFFRWFYFLYPSSLICFLIYYSPRLAWSLNFYSSTPVFMSFPCYPHLYSSIDHVYF